MTGKLPCPLCAAKETGYFWQDRHREYLCCGQCSLVFVPPAFHLSPAAEKAEYDLHENAPDDPGYRHFLSRLVEPLLQRLTPGMTGLDFGCGPGPALSEMLREAGFAVTLYDPFYHPDQGVLARSYDFICATEVVEHLHRPGDELTRLWALLNPGGTLGVMTKLVRNREAFAGWHYKNDLTHVCFFSRDTWTWWARQNAAELEFVGADVILLRQASPAVVSISR